MKRRGIHWVLLGGVLLFIVACSGSIVAELYFTDIFEIVDDNALVHFTRATIEIETVSEKPDEALNNKIREWFRDAKNFRVISRDFSSYLQADIKIPIINYSNRWFDSSGDLITLLVDTDSEGTILLGFSFAKAVFEKINAYLFDTYFTTLKIGDWQFTIEVKNDTKEEKIIDVLGVYANQEPVLYGKPFSLEPRDSLQIRFGDVLRDYGYQNEQAVFGVIYWLKGSVALFW